MTCLHVQSRLLVRCFTRAMGMLKCMHSLSQVQPDVRNLQPFRQCKSIAGVVHSEKTVLCASRNAAWMPPSVVCGVATRALIIYIQE